MAESDVLRRRIPDDEVYRPIFEAEVITFSLYVKSAHFCLSVWFPIVLADLNFKLSIFGL